MKNPILNQAKEALASHPHFKGRAKVFQLEESAGSIVVRGTVPTFYLKQLLQDALKRVSGVERVDNRVVVISEPCRSEAG